MSALRGLAWAFAAYALAAILLFYHPGFLTGTTFLCDGGTDASLYIWMFRFLPHAILHLQNPLVLKEAWAPFGLNITQATTTPLPALLAWPITAAAGPVVAFNVVSMACPALAATACYAFARSYARRWSAAFIAGWIYGFSSAVFAPLLGHLQVDFIAFLPLAFLAVRQRATGAISAPVFYILLVLVLIAQFLTSLENFVMEAIFLGLFTIAAEASRPGGFRRAASLGSGNLILGLAASYLSVLFLMSPFIYYFFSDYGQIPHNLQSGWFYATDIVNFVVPTPITLLGGALAQPVSRLYPGNTSEELGYIGAPLVLFTLFAAWRLRRERTCWPLLTLLAAAFIATLGPSLHVMGRSTIPLPWALMDRLPFLSNALPSRLMPFLLIAIAGLCAFWIDHRAASPRTAAVLLACAALFMLPASRVRPHFWHSPTPTAQLFASGDYRNVIGKGQTVLFLPFNFAAGDAMYYQTEAGGWFRMTNGYGNFVPPGLDSWPAVKMLEAGMPGPGFTQQFGLFTHAAGVNKVVMPVDISSTWNQALERGGWHPQILDGFAIYTRKPGQQTAPLISPEEAQYRFASAHFAALRAAAGCMLAKGARTIDIPRANATHCLTAGFAPMTSTPGENWDKLGGWLGIYGPGIGLGLDTDTATADRLVASTGAGALAIFFPYPDKFVPGSHARRTGELLEVFPQAAITGTN